MSGEGSSASSERAIWHVMISNWPWDSLSNANQRLARALARQDEVTFVEPLRGARPWGGEAPGRLRTSRTEEGVQIWRATGLPGQRLAPVAALNLRWLGRRLSRQARDRGQDPVLWLHPPRSAALGGLLPGALVIYHSMDLAEPRAEGPLLDRAEIVFCLSRWLYAHHRSRCGERAYYLPNGADLELFSEAAGRTLVPRDLADLEGPVIGYAGNVGRVLDHSLLYRLARAQPQWSLVFLGPVDPGVEPWRQRMSQLPNVRFLGYRPAEQVARYVARFDVGLIPYQADHPRIIACRPEKLFDYLSLGRPVVSTSFPAVQEYQPVVRVAETPEEFEGEIREALIEDGGARERRRVAEEVAYRWLSAYAREVILEALDRRRGVGRQDSVPHEYSYAWVRRRASHPAPGGARAVRDGP